MKQRQGLSHSGFTRAKLYVKKYWNTPKDGEYVSLKEFCFYCVGTSGANLYTYMGQFFFWGAGFFCGAIMGISQMDFYKIGVIGTVFGYLFMWLTPINMLIYENFGKLEKRIKVFAHIAMAVKLAIGIALYFVPSSAFEDIMKGLPQILANSLVISVFNFYSDWFVRYKFSEKYGRIKPFILLYGLPIVVVGTIIPYIDYSDMSYTVKLVVLHFMFNFMVSMSTDYSNPQNMVTFITPNSMERQKFYSLAPFVTNILISLIAMIFPILAVVTGGYTSLLTYKVFVPILCGSGVFMSYAIAGVKERVIEKKGEERVKVKFLKGAKQAFKNKYLWIVNISGLIGSWSGIAGNVMLWWFIYSVRSEWAIGLAGTITVLPCNLAFLLTVYLIKRYERKNVYIGMKMLEIVCLLGWAAAIHMDSIVFFVIVTGVKNLFSTTAGGANNGFLAEIMEYHQWRYGERCDSIAGIFGWITGPLGTAAGYILPAVLATAGYTSDWDVFYDRAIMNNLFNIYIWGAFIGTILGLIPFFFFDLTREKNQFYISELKKRLQDSGDESAELTGRDIFPEVNVNE